MSLWKIDMCGIGYIASTLLLSVFFVGVERACFQ